jgi:HAD superfamily hydrolase (TIGR01509 family)
VLVDSEGVWDSVREQLAHERGGRWHEHAMQDMLGMSSIEWSRYMHDVIRVPMEPEAISDLVVKRVMESYRDQLPLLPGAVEAVRAAAERWPLGLATSSNRPVIDLVLELSGLAPCFQATVSSEEVGRGKPAPDVYLEAARRLGTEPTSCGAIEDSTNGIKAAKAAGMFVAAIPQPDLPPAPDALETADMVLESLERLPGRLSDMR